LACAVALLCALGCSLPTAASAADIVVRRDAGLSAGERAAVRADAGVTLDRTLAFPDTELVSVAEGRQEQALEQLNADPDVRYAVPNVKLRVADDDLQWLQWALENTGRTPQKDPVVDADIDAPQAWDVMEGQNITVGLVDQSVYANHPDLSGQVEPALDFLHGEGCAAGDPTGFADHGTHVAGILAAKRDNGGIAGVAPLAHVLPLRAVDNCGIASLDAIIDAFTYAGREHIPIVNASLATVELGANPGLNRTFADIFTSYPETLYVVAAGNEGANLDANQGANAAYPCSTKGPGTTDIANLLCVGMTDVRDDAACWGNVGASVDLFAPGVSIYSTVRGINPYQYLTGTSQAVPMVAGAAAILLSMDPRPSAEQVAQLLRATVDLKSAFTDISVAGGRLNVARAADVPGRLGSGGGEAKPWVSCDRDHDGFRDDGPADKCPDLPGPGTPDGCPDADGDGRPDNVDNCANVANADQADADGDGKGNACDETPRGDDVDGDFKPFLDDRCPFEPASSSDGCPVVVNPPKNDPPVPTPVPTATPQGTPGPVIVSLRAKVSKCPKGKTCTKVAKVTVKLSRQAKVALKVERQVRKKGRLVWTRVSSRSLTANTRGSTLTVRGKRGKPSSKYRVTATLAGKAKAVSFRV
jgi:hypothetical protein